MPRARLPKGKKITEDKFFSMKENPEGASIGNFVKNVKTITDPIREILSQGSYKPPTESTIISPTVITKAPTKTKVRRGRFQKFY